MGLPEGEFWVKVIEVPVRSLTCRVCRVGPRYLSAVKKRGKQNLYLGICGGLNIGVQVVIKGGETNLHAHPGNSML